ncbi:hypothetical protein LZZ85_12210 [Terrimonas sp. NA20]|uniref:Gliding motility-associated protein GldM N-terminal domain-containing protein n=1 Tax=Terrimonas ginsenosidimutans TaxID=2908004 RepID=A0ABS9KRU0_9BACT|nr:hypothetical protein [Terrimonas ginsenosidimutans]MCG2615053.1 hypothetical protein [Terrimonas ginsenosidimutans]
MKKKNMQSFNTPSTPAGDLPEPHRFSFRHLSWLLPLITMFFSCDTAFRIAGANEDISVTEAASDTETLLQDAINTLQDESQSWQTTLKNLADQLTGETQSTISNEVTDLIARAQASAGAELKCYTDFFRTRMKQELTRLIDMVRGRNDLPSLEPIFCTAVPSSIDMNLAPDRRNKIELFGYDFDRYSISGANIKAALISTSGMVDVTEHLTQQSIYLMTLNLGSNGIQLTENSSKIRFTSGGKLIAELPVIQQRIARCAVTEGDLRPIEDILDFVPGKVGAGDRDFGGSVKIRMTFKLSVSSDGQSVSAKIFMRAKEYQTMANDHSHAEKTETFTLYRAPAGYLIEDILSEKNYVYEGIDKDHDVEIFNIAGGYAIKKLKVYGDRWGEDIGSYTKASFYLQDIKVRLRQSRNCR